MKSKTNPITYMDPYNVKMGLTHSIGVGAYIFVNFDLRRSLQRPKSPTTECGEASTSKRVMSVDIP